jgi:hypothetical protein
VGDFSDGEGVGDCVGSVEVVVDIFEENLKVARRCRGRIGIEDSNYREIWMGRNEGKVDLKSRSD